MRGKPPAATGRRPRPAPGGGRKPPRAASPEVEREVERSRSRLLLFNKPYGVLSQFTPEGRWRGLADHIAEPGVYVAGRLDADSEGLLLLTDDGKLQQKIADPRFKLPKIYWVQVEGIPDEAALEQLRRGVALSDFTTLPCKVRRIEEPAGLWPRQPPVRFRAAIPTSWLEIELREGKNRQVRRMTAQVGFPTLRLIRFATGGVSLCDLAPGAIRRLEGPAASLLEKLRQPLREHGLQSAADDPAD